MSRGERNGNGAPDSVVSGGPVQFKRRLAAYPQAAGWAGGAARRDFKNTRADAALHQMILALRRAYLPSPTKCSISLRSMPMASK